MRRHSSPGPRLWAALWTGVVVVLAVVSVQGRAGSARMVLHHPGAQNVSARNLSESRVPVAARGSLVLTESEWGQQLGTASFWSRRGSRSGEDQPRRSLTGREFGATRRVSSEERRPKKLVKAEADSEDANHSGGTYRTMCVRLCDGFYWPVSYAATSDKFEDDAALCARSCGGPQAARLFTYRNPGSEIENMEDLRGRAYAKLEKAFAFKVKYDPTCKCHADPWEEASTERHRSYALVVQARKGDMVAAQQLSELQPKLVGEPREGTAPVVLRGQRGRIAMDTFKAKAKGAVVSEPAPYFTTWASTPPRAVSAPIAALIQQQVKRANRKMAGVSVAATAKKRGAQPGALAAISGEGQRSALGNPVHGPSGFGGLSRDEGVVILRYGTRAPMSVTVPTRRAADAAAATVRLP